MKLKREIICVTIFITFMFFSCSSFYNIKAQSDEAIVYDVIVDNNIAYVSYGSEGLHIVDVSNIRNPQLLSVYDYPGEIVDAFILNQQIFALFSNSSLRIIDVVDPIHPILRGSIPLPYHTYNVVVDNYNIAYIAAGENGLKIINVTDTSSLYIIETYDSIGEIKDVKIKNNLAYLADGSNGFLTLNISNRENPTLISHLDTDYCENIFVGDFFTYLACGSYGLKIVDVTNSSDPSTVGAYWTSNKISSVFVESNDIAYVTDGDGGLKIVDVGTPSVPVMLGYLDTTSTTRSVCVSGTYAFVANTENLLIVDVSSLSAPFISSSYSSEDGSAVTIHEPIEGNTIILIIASIVSGVAFLVLLLKLGPFIRMTKTWKEDTGPFTNSLSISLYLAISGLFLWLSYNAFMNGNMSLMYTMLFASPLIGGLIGGIFVFKKDWAAVTLPLALLLGISVFCIMTIPQNMLFIKSFFTSIGVLLIALVSSAIGRTINQVIVKEKIERSTLKSAGDIECPECGEKIPSSSKFCYNCGFNTSE